MSIHRRTSSLVCGALAALGLALAAGVAAQTARAEQPAAPQSTCPPTDVSDYKERAQTEAGRLDLATRGCGFKALQEQNEKAGRKRPAEQCGVEVGKLRDVLDLSGDRHALDFMKGRCVDSGARNG